VSLKAVYVFCQDALLLDTVEYTEFHLPDTVFTALKSGEDMPVLAFSVSAYIPETADILFRTKTLFTNSVDGII
jgi:hypothetical protein